MGGGSYRILVAEDDADFLGMLEELLGGDPRFEVVAHATNGREAVELSRTVTIDAAVVDIEMPEVDGVEATRQLQPLPVLAISGHDYEERVLDMRQAGAGDYVRKARVHEELCDALAALLER
ncbi:MAG TPA: response regulator [Gaiellaceae bacterium]|nr:response regulator [Gaiellaceae bacterium]